MDLEGAFSSQIHTDQAAVEYKENENCPKLTREYSTMIADNLNGLDIALNKFAADGWRAISVMWRPYQAAGEGGDYAVVFERTHVE